MPSLDLHFPLRKIEVIAVDDSKRREICNFYGKMDKL